jgi:hypothetical protein
MAKAVRRGLLLLLALGVLAVPAVASGRQLGDLSDSGSGASRDGRRSLQVVGLTTDGRLVRFDTHTPGRTRNIGRVKGLDGDQSLVGVDYRVQDGRLYGVGNAGGIYTLSTGDAAATKVGQLAPTGKLLVDAGPVAGFDIYSRQGFGTTRGNRGFASIPVLGRYSLYEADVLTGQAARVGSFRASAQVADIAIPLDQG